jgi:hypothetical protein
MEHIRDALGISGHSLFPMWFLLDRDNPGAKWNLVGVARERAEEWISFLEMSNGSAITELTDTPAPSGSAPTICIFSDAALEPPSEAGMGGLPAPGHYWHIPMAQGLWGLTIPVMEYTAAGINLIMNYELNNSPRAASSVWLAWEVDALGPLLVLKAESAKQPMMRRVDQLIRESDAFKHYHSALILRHT